VKFSWTAPTDSGGNAITINAYRVTIRAADGTTFVMSPTGTGCNPTSTAAVALIVTNAWCEMEMADLSAAPYTLLQGAQIIATVEAEN
jgi:hypothetical protein